MKTFKVILFTYLIACTGAFIFHFASLPIPWILGPLSFVLITKMFTKQKTMIPKGLNNTGLMFIGIYFGMSFTESTISTVAPYLIPFIISTILLLAVSILISIVITSFIDIDPITSVFGSIPGGLSEMVAASESLSANSALVTILQTVRLLTVVFTVPFLAVHMFSMDVVNLGATPPSITENKYFEYLWFVPAMLVGWMFRNILPAAYVLGPLIVIATLNIFGVSLPMIPLWVLVIAQITVGISMGNKISLSDLKLGGKYCGYYFILTILLILTSVGFGYLFSLFTTLSLSTSILSLAPGGMVEMVLTAKAIGADSAVVSALQLIRLLFIILIVPSFLKFVFTKRIKNKELSA
ncbi:AbrB family transcriptional regulator [Litchfieldia alkalitelluris]|uniref:AbrB family transcriptional regulator n=1 Tax=Litchfieldia alkalitelluris TaxID=304268 RepID=UPI000997EF55|nr:AbrB family transcriptional regulator [Litchfieldia alkalitelluris]